MNAYLLYLAAVVTLVLSGVLLLLGAVTLKTGLALDSFALAAWAVAASGWRP